MIRCKDPAADLRRGYLKVLGFSLGLSALLHLGLFGVNPAIEIQPKIPPRELIVLELQPIPQTRQHLPPPPPEPHPVARPVRDLVLPRRTLQVPREAVVEFALEEEEEEVEFWMVEQKPLVLHRVLPAYPDSARQALIEGTVFARVLVDQRGRVERVERVRGPEIFHQVVASAARQWEFSPAVQNDRRVKVWVSLPFSFRLE